MKIEWLPVIDVDEEIAVAVTAGIVLTVFWVLLWVEIKQAPFSLALLTQTVASNYIKLENFLFVLLVPILSMWIFLGLTTAGLLPLPRREAGLLPLRLYC